MADFTATQGRYLAFIHAYTSLHGCPPAESDIAAAMCVSPPSVNMMVKTLEKKGLILRHPGQPRSLQVLIDEDEIPTWNNRKTSVVPAPGKMPDRPPSFPKFPPANLYVLSVYLLSGPTSAEVRQQGDRPVDRDSRRPDAGTRMLFKAYDRHDEHLYEFQSASGLRSKGAQLRSLRSWKRRRGGDARTTRIDDLGPEKGPSVRILVRLRRRLVSSGRRGADRTSHSDRDLSARHQAHR